MKPVALIALVLVIVGALNWGLVGLFQFDLVAALLGAGSALSRIVYALVGVSGVVLLTRMKTLQRSGVMGAVGSSS